MYTGFKWLLLLYVLNGFFKLTLKPFLFLLINQAFIFLRFFFFEYHIFGYIITGGYCQNHVDNNIILFGCNCHHLFPEHGLRYILMRVVKCIQRFMHEDYSNLVGGVAAATGPTHHHHHHHNHQSKKTDLVSFNKFEDKFISCTECNKKFKSMKVFFGHMRCDLEKY